MREMLILILGILAAGLGALMFSTWIERAWRRRHEMQMRADAWETFQRRVGGGHDR